MMLPALTVLVVTPMLWNGSMLRAVRSAGKSMDRRPMSRHKEQGERNAPGISMILTAYFSCLHIVGDFVFQSQNIAIL